MIWPAARKFVAEIFQDVDDGFSMKRTMFFVLIVALLVVVFGAVYVTRVEPGVLNEVLGTLERIIEWLGGFIVAERAPAIGRALKSVVAPSAPPPQK